jgi:uncharacterized SAM-binding protein YcdF (DUF218 family)
VFRKGSHSDSGIRASRQSKSKRRAPIGLLAAGIPALLALFLWQGEQFLTLKTTPTAGHIDAVVVLAGAPDEDKVRLEEALRLVQADRDARLILPLRHTRVTWPWLVRYYRLPEFMSTDRVIVRHENGDGAEDGTNRGGTFLEARKTIHLMLEHGLETALVVSSPYHMRRAKLAFEKASNGHPLRFFYHPVPRSSDDETPWWMDGRYLARVVQEYGKLIAAYTVLY